MNIKAQIKPRLFPRPQTSNVKSGNGYIVMPPQENSLFKSEGAETPNLDTFGVKNTEKLNLVGGYLAELSPAQVKKMEDSGYQIFKDEVKTYIPNYKALDMNAVAEKAIAEAEGKIADGETPAEGASEGNTLYKPRNEMTEPRSNSTIEKAFRGNGVTIAVLDSGVAYHPDLGERYLGQIDFVKGEPIPYDDNGHGTHVAVTAAGNGSMNPMFAGPAQEANVISMKVLSGEGSGKTSDIIKAIQTAVEMKDELNIKVINMSLGGPASKNGESDPINQAIKAAKEAGVTVVVAAGNEGPDRKTVGSPGNSLNAITVGAIDDNNTADPSDDKPAEFSSRGPTPDGITKPDVMAPGVTIMAGRSHQSESAQMASRMNMMHESIRFLDEMPFEQLQKAPNALFNSIGIGDETAEKIKLFEPISDMVFKALSEATARMPESEDGLYLGMSGTSMATPYVAGVTAQLIGANPDMTPDQIQDILTSTAVKLPDGRLGKNTQGHGVVNPEQALLKALQTEGEAVKEAELIKDPLAILADMGLSLEDIVVDD
ncbi:MAG: S8 family peptidase, partial [Candidatus Eremiobacteraeota bacterium]|nr:S8 family peptidase [Candidatus Eremiobacteraeota bacterium]